LNSPNAALSGNLLPVNEISAFGTEYSRCEQNKVMESGYILKGKQELRETAGMYFLLIF